MIEQGPADRRLARTRRSHNYIKALVKGVVKVMSKMGICTIDGYRGAQIFEALGLNQDVIDRYFTWTASRVGGIGMDVIADETLSCATAGVRRARRSFETLDAGGHYQWRSDGEHHQLNPMTVHTLQKACRTDDYSVFKEYSALMNDQDATPVTLRSLLDLELRRQAGADRRGRDGRVDRPALQDRRHVLRFDQPGSARGAGHRHEPPGRQEQHRRGRRGSGALRARLPNGDSRSSAIKQVASGRFGVTSHYLVQRQEIQIKIAQGAKPGEGGQLPGRKVYPVDRPGAATRRPAWA